jgi:hypothetical protein
MSTHLLEPDRHDMEAMAAAATDLVGQPERDDHANQELLTRISATRRIHISSTLIDGRFTLRLCIISHRTHHDRVAEAVDIIRGATRQASPLGRSARPPMSSSG